MKWNWIAILALGTLAISGCAKTSTDATAPAAPSANPSAANTPVPTVSANVPASDRDAIEQAIRQHLVGNRSINMAAMDMTLGQVSINGSQAQADAEFRLKTGGPAMQMSYSLERHAGGWIVLNGAPSGGQFVHPPMDKSHSPAAPAAGSQGMPDVSSFMKTLPPPKKDAKPRE